MKGFFTQETVDIKQALDIVQWRLGDRKVRLYYQTAATISAQIRVFAKAAVTRAGENQKLWRDLSKYETEPSNVRLNRGYRRSGYLSNVQWWRVDVEGDLVVVYFDDLVAKFHCTDALVFQACLYRAAKNAKNWAGDGSRGLMLTAHLTDASINRPVGMGFM